MRQRPKGKNKVNVVWTVMFDVYPLDNPKDLIIRNGFLDEDFLTKKEFARIDKIVTKHHNEINYGLRSPDINNLTED